jgi:citrate synthase
VKAVQLMDALAGSGRLRPRRSLVRFLAQLALFDDEERRRSRRPKDGQLGDVSRLIATMACSLGWLRCGPDHRQRRRSGSVAGMLLSSLGVAMTAETVAATDAALVLCADHELAQSTFVARIAASAGADMGECIAAAILTQSGATSVRSYERAEEFLRRCTSLDRTRRLFDGEQAGHRNPPGFNHPLYPKGDPRARRVIDIARRLPHPDPAVGPAYAALGVAAERGCLPSLEAGLSILVLALGLPPRSPYGLFTVGRTAGWAAHVMEQRSSGVLLRPRAGYTAGQAHALLQLPLGSTPSGIVRPDADGRPTGTSGQGLRVPQPRPFGPALEGQPP